MALVYELFYLLSKKEKLLFILVLLISIIMSFIDIIGITAVMPFISIASSPKVIDTNHFIHLLYNYSGISSKRNFVIVFGLTVVIFIIFRAIFSGLFRYIISKFSFDRYHSFADRLFNMLLKMRYQDFVTQDSSTIISIITNEVDNSTIVISQILAFYSELVIILLLYSLILVVDFKLTICLTIILGLIPFLSTKFVTNIIKKTGNIRSRLKQDTVQIISQTCSNLKIIKLFDNEDNILNLFSKLSKNYSRINILNGTLPYFPRIILEAAGISILILIALYVLITTNDAFAVIPVITLYAMVLIRMLPSAQRMLINHAQIVFYGKSLNIIRQKLSYNLEDEKNQPLEFTQHIILKNIYFAYDTTEVISDINLVIHKGERVAIIGESGGGKTTLADIIMGILKPKSGEILIDNQILTNDNIRSWRKKIGYIPQSIYLFRGTVAQNVAFGSQYDEQRVIACLIKANIYDFLSQQKGIHTQVGDGGIKLSGGQKQRIGIARALYSDPEILVLDEATSALDNETESKIMDEIYNLSLGKTFLVIAHRLSTVNRCDRIIEIENYHIK